MYFKNTTWWALHRRTTSCGRGERLAVAELNGLIVEAPCVPGSDSSITRARAYHLQRRRSWKGNLMDTPRMACAFPQILSSCWSIELECVCWQGHCERWDLLARSNLEDVVVAEVGLDAVLEAQPPGRWATPPGTGEPEVAAANRLTSASNSMAESPLLPTSIAPSTKCSSWATLQQESDDVLERALLVGTSGIQVAVFAMNRLRRWRWTACGGGCDRPGRS